jgi:hypothetical protein
MIELLIARLDRDDGDPDLEEPGLEDSFVEHREGFGADGPGCPVSDAGGPSWREQFDQTGAPFGSHLLQGTATIGAHEDEEDDDPMEDNGDASDGSFAEDEPAASYRRWNGPGCSFSDPGGCEHDGREPEHDA